MIQQENCKLLYHLDQEQTICLFILICLILENGIFFVRLFWKLFCFYLDSRPTTKNLFVRAPNDENRICGVMSNVFASSVVDRWFEPRSGQTKDYKIGICCFPSKHTSFRSKSKGWHGIGIICPSGATYLSANCCFNELALWKYNSACWSSTKWISSSSHWKLTCFAMIYMYIYTIIIAELALNNNHSPTPKDDWYTISCLTLYFYLLICSSHTKISNENIGYCSAERYTCPQNEQCKY